MPNEYRGTPVPLRQRFTQRFSPTSGHTGESEWRSFDLHEIQRYFNYFANAGCEVELEYSNGTARLYALDSTGAFTIDTWEVQVNQVFVSSLLNPFNIENIPAGYLELIAEAIKNGSTIAEAAATLEEATGDIYVDDISDNEWAVRLYKRMLGGDDSFLAYRYILRHTTNVSNRYQINVADQWVNYVFSTAELLTETQDNDSWVYPLPGRLAYKLNNIPAPSVDQIDANSFWGWLKSASSESTSAKNRVNIVTEYVLAAWKTDEYLLR